MESGASLKQNALLQQLNNVMPFGQVTEGVPTGLQGFPGIDSGQNAVTEGFGFVPQFPDGPQIPTHGGLSGPGDMSGLGGLTGLGQPHLQPHPAYSAGGQDAAQTVLDAAAPVPSSHPYAQEKATTRRRLEQLGIPLTNDNRMHVWDMGYDHGGAVVRAQAGETGLAQGANITLDAPAPDPNRPPAENFGLGPTAPDATSKDLIADSAYSLVGSVDLIRDKVDGLAAAKVTSGDDGKVFFNYSLGRNINDEADQTVARMMLAKPGTPLYEETTKLLGAPPIVEEFERDGRSGVRLDEDQRMKLKREHVLPQMQAVIDSPEFQQEFTLARDALRGSVQAARDQGIMIFSSAGNHHDVAQKFGRPGIAEGVASGVDGIFRVGAVEANGPGTEDDTITVFSSPGVIDAAATGTGLPIGLDKDGNLQEREGTSFASPLMNETAYVMSGANPNLSLDEIESLLKDPRVAHNIAGTERDGAGSVDAFAAVVLAQNPNLNRAQLNAIRAQLDANPNANFRIQPDGSLQML